MGRHREKSGKEGQLANFPEEQPTTLLSPRYLAITTSLILVFSAFASLLIQEEITGQATSSTMQRWRQQGIIADWESGGISSYVPVNARDALGRVIVPAHYRCPGEALEVPERYVSTRNEYGCFNTQDKNGILAMCAVANAKEQVVWKKCISL